jgi:hypothetical protein
MRRPAGNIIIHRACAAYVDPVLDLAGRSGSADASSLTRAALLLAKGKEREGRWTVSDK